MIMEEESMKAEIGINHAIIEETEVRKELATYFLNLGTEHIFLPTPLTFCYVFVVGITPN